MIISNLKPLTVVGMLLVPNACKTLTLQKNLFDKTALAIFLSLFLMKISKWPNTLKQFVGNLPTNCLSVFDHFVGLALKGLKGAIQSLITLTPRAYTFS